MKAIYFDMDGTIADLYNYPDWLRLLQEENVEPYENAADLVDMRELNEVLNALVAIGYTIGVISWGAMNCSNAYTRATKKAKVAWCEARLDCITEYHVVKYGTPKHKVRKIQDSILVDDNAEVREAWQGATIDASNPAQMLKALWALLGTKPPRKPLKMSEKMKKAKEENLFSPLFEKHMCGDSGLYMLGQTTRNPRTDEKRFWLKVGLTTDPYHRFNSYLTHSADIYFIDYVPIEIKEQLRHNEQICHELLEKIASTFRTEWFKISEKMYFELCEKGFTYFPILEES
jgi:hypothetical protein